MKNTQKSILTAEWLTIKSMYEANTNGSNKYGTNFPIEGELDQLSLTFIDKIGVLTAQLGYDCVIDGVKMDLWKERIWSLVENAGLLPEIAWKDELAEEEAEIKDNWYSDNDDFDADLEAQSYEVFGLEKI
jgi:hypothetical protein